MLPHKCAETTFLFVCVILLLATCRAGAAETLYSVQRDTMFFNQDPSLPNDQAQDSTISKGTLVKLLPDQSMSRSGQLMQRITTVEKNARNGWVPADALILFETAIQLLELRAKTNQNQVNPETIPQLIRAQENPEIRTAWEEASEAFDANEKLPEDQRLPDPYFARAEIWYTLNNYIAAIENYVEGIRYARKTNQDILTYAVYFTKLQTAAENLLSLPVPPEGVNQNLPARGFLHFNRGVSSYLRGDYKKAIEELSDAVSLVPTDPLIWYYRGLAMKANGELARGQHDVLLGVHFEKDLSPGRRRAINRSLFRVQGSDRLWLEHFRLGSPNGYGLVSFNN